MKNGSNANEDQIGAWGSAGLILAGSIDDGNLLYHHSCKAGASRIGNNVITVRVERAPGCSNSTT
jgi:hypothetical protein